MDVKQVSHVISNNFSSRRAFICRSVVVSGSLISFPALAMPPEAETPNVEPRRQLSLVNEQTQELLDVVYWEDGKYIDDHVGQLNYFMRDQRANKSFLMDPGLYDFLNKLYTVLDTDERIHVLSGYRTAETNALLRKATPFAAKRSFHVHGRAVDFYIPGIDNNYIQREARRLIFGGVGYYKKAGFVHIDTGYPRHWSSD